MNKYIIALLVIFSISEYSGQAVQGQLLGTWTDDTLPASFAHNNIYNEIWGYEKAGKEYAIIGTVYDSKEYIRRSHNIFIDTSAAILYSCISDGENVTFAPLRLFDISDPYQPAVLADYSEIGGFDFSQVHDAFVIQDTAYLNCGPFGFLVADFTDPLAPQALGSLSSNDYPQSGYNHSGWLSEDRQTYFMADEDWDMDIKVLDVTQLPELVVLDTIDAGNEDRNSIPHNQVAHGDYLYCSYYYDGLQVWDISDRDNIERVMHYPTSQLDPRSRYEGAWGVYPFLPSGNILVSDMQEGLFIIEPVADALSLTTEAEKKLEAAWTISPNPSDGTFIITSDIPLTDLEICIHSSDGKVIQQLDASGRYNLELVPAPYFITVGKENLLSTKTLMVVEK